MDSSAPSLNGSAERTNTDALQGKSDWSTYRRLLRYVRPYTVIFLISTLGFFMGSGAEAYFLRIFGNLIESWGEPNELVRLIPLTMMGLALLRALGYVTGELLLSNISFNVVHKIRTQLFDQLLLMPSAFFDASSQGHLVSRITYNVDQLRDTGTDALKTIIQDGAKIIVYFGALVWISWQLTLLFAAIAPVVAFVVVYASRRFRRISKRIQLSMGDVTHVASETVSGYRVVRIFGGEPYESDRFHKASGTNRRQNLKMVATKVASTQIIQIFVVAVIASMIWLLDRPDALVLSTSDIVSFLGLAGMLVRPIQKLSEVNARLQRGLAAAEDVFGQMDQAPEFDGGAVDAERVAGRVEFRNVSFSYPEGSSVVLENLDLTIEPGQSVAVVGKSGSGKSTLAALIPRFYEPDKGEILLDGVPLADYRLDALRRQIALVTQQVTLFNDTLACNIAYGGLVDASEAQIRDAIERAHADGFIDELPEQLETVVGDDGVLLSGGQRQRVAIARALLKDAPVLILDEATSALDTESERHIQAALEEVMRERTTLVIAHRLSTIENADIILVMDNGRIVESGDHEALLDRQGAYAALYNAQFEDEPTESPVAAAVPTTRELPASNAERPFGTLTKAWYSGAWWTVLLAPLSWIFTRVAARRRWAYMTGRKTPWRAEVPVVVVGNITAGGTGKTPLVVWLVNRLKAQGFSPGIVSRGYGGAESGSPVLVHADSDPDIVGDEPPLVAARTGCPVVVCRNRVAATRFLLEHMSPDIVVSDDGLQHYALARDVEIAVLDGYRGIGNGRSLPAGPLREPVSRLAEVDWVVANGRATGLVEEESVMQVKPVAFVRVAPDIEEGERMSCEAFARRYRNVHAVAGVGNPARFAQTLRELNLEPLLRSYDDHHRFDGSELVFDNDWPMVFTEKDAVKIRRLGKLPQNCWYLEIDVELPGASDARLVELMHKHGIGCE